MRIKVIILIKIVSLYLTRAYNAIRKKVYDVRLEVISYVELKGRVYQMGIDY